ncbi:MAG: hypothetical protein Q8M03_17155 [Legionella sp.]|nr:hypothetical protein [Legionella sp.]
MDWKELQKEINKTLDPLLTRSEYYKNGIEILRNAFINYFLGKTAKDALLPGPATDAQLANLNLFKENMRACFASHEILAADPVSRAWGLNTIIHAFILGGGIPLMDVRGSFQLNPKCTETPEQTSFMKQFAHALTIYRVYVSIVDAYQALLNYPFLNTTEDFKYKDQAEELQKQLSQGVDEDELRWILQEAKAAKKEIDKLLEKSRPSSLVAQERKFADAFPNENTKIVQLFEEGQIQIENCYREFPNTSYTCYIWDTDWQTLVKSVAGYFFKDKYEYDSGTSTLKIKAVFTEAFGTEISNVHEKIMDNQYQFRAMLLRTTADVFSKIINRGKDVFALNKIDAKVQVQLSTQNFYNQEREYTVYHLFNDLKCQWMKNAKQHTDSVKDSEEPGKDEDTTLFTQGSDYNTYHFYHQLMSQKSSSLSDKEEISAEADLSYKSYS